MTQRDEHVSPSPLPPPEWTLVDAADAAEATALIDDDIRATMAMNNIMRAADGDQVVEMECCSICLLELDDDPSSTLRPCGHAFHTACIDKWFHSCVEVNSGQHLGRAGLLAKLSCPNCRECPTLSSADARRVFPGAPGEPGTLEQLDASPTVSPENAYLYEVVRRVQRMNETRDPSTGRIRFFRPEDGLFTVIGKSAMYVVLFVPASAYFLVRRMLIPGAVRLAVSLRDWVANLPPPPDFGALALQAGRAVYRHLLRPVGRAAAYVGDVAMRAARAVKYAVYDCVLAPTGVATRDWLLIPLCDGTLWMLRKGRDGIVWTACKVRDGGLWTLRKGRDGGLWTLRKVRDAAVFVLRTVRDQVLLPARDGGVCLLKALRDHIVLPARDGAVRLFCAARDGAVWLLRMVRDGLLLPARDGAVYMLRAARDWLLIPLKDGAVFVLRVGRDRLLVPLAGGLVFVLRKGGHAVASAVRWLWRTVLVPTGRGAWHVGGLVWRSFTSAAAFLGRATLRGVVNVGMSLLEVACVLRDVLISSYDAIKRGMRLVGTYLLAGAKAVLAPIVAVTKAIAGAIALATAVSAVAVYDYVLRPTYQAVSAVCGSVASAAVHLARALRDHILMPLATQSRRVVVLIVTQINALVLQPLVGALKVAMQSVAAVSRQVWVQLTTVIVVTAAAVRDMAAAIAAVAGQALAAASAAAQAMADAMSQIQRDMTAALVELYRMLERAARGKGE